MKQELSTITIFVREIKPFIIWVEFITEFYIDVFLFAKAVFLEGVSSNNSKLI